MQPLFNTEGQSHASDISCTPSISSNHIVLHPRYVLDADALLPVKADLHVIVKSLQLLNV